MNGRTDGQKNNATTNRRKLRRKKYDDHLILVILFAIDIFLNKYSDGSVEV